MDHIVKKLSEIEHAAEAVVEHAELEKSELEERIQNERNQFDKSVCPKKCLEEPLTESANRSTTLDRSRLKRCAMSTDFR